MIKMQKKTNEGFAVGTFTDCNNEKCSIQMGSAIVEPRVWLGLDNPKPRVIKNGEWVDVDLPTDAFTNGRMYLNRDQALSLIKVLEHFVETGTLPTSQEKLLSEGEAIDMQEALYDEYGEYAGIISEFDDEDDVDEEDYKRFQRPPVSETDRRRELTRGVSAQARASTTSESDTRRLFAQRDALVHRIRVLDPSVLSIDDLEDLKIMHEALDRICMRHNVSDAIERKRNERPPQTCRRSEAL